ncbi:MAG: hypothetical protein QNJ12_15260 [Ilumatobacter sp.]|uniref:hypothetical protein n=1 Tax=Ilumatobacter sp. TaxID=1967498 RepID=UPI0026124B46|nr:hypothetical protein [Ilumatobacter sp.]MDJ0770159.1 hypothetical protein [Ilumatobacter sp.]
MSRHRLTAWCALVAAVAACGGDDDTGSTCASPVDGVDDAVALVDAALAEVEAAYGTPQEYFEISASAEGVSVIVAAESPDGTVAERSLCGDGFVPPEAVGAASGFTFTAAAVEFDPDAVFEQMRAELDDPDIVDFAIQAGSSDGSVIYDASIRSAAGGTLFVLLGPDGEILGTQAG